MINPAVAVDAPRRVNWPNPTLTPRSRIGPRIAASPHDRLMAAIAYRPSMLSRSVKKTSPTERCEAIQARDRGETARAEQSRRR